MSLSLKHKNYHEFVADFTIPLDTIHITTQTFVTSFLCPSLSFHKNIYVALLYIFFFRKWPLFGLTSKNDGKLLSNIVGNIGHRKCWAVRLIDIKALNWPKYHRICTFFRCIFSVLLCFFCSQERSLTYETEWFYLPLSRFRRIGRDRSLLKKVSWWLMNIRNTICDEWNSFKMLKTSEGHKIKINLCREIKS